MGLLKTTKARQLGSLGFKVLQLWKYCIFRVCSIVWVKKSQKFCKVSILSCPKSWQYSHFYHRFRDAIEH